MLCAVQMSLHWREQNPTQEHPEHGKHITLAGASPALCPCVSSCPGVPRAGHVCYPPGSPAGQPQLCQSSQDRNRMGYFPYYTSRSHGQAEKMQLALIWRGFHGACLPLAKHRWNWKEQSTIPAESLGNTGTNQCLCRATKMLRPGPKPAEHIPSVKPCSAGLSKAVMLPGLGTHFSTAGVNRNNAKGRAPWLPYDSQSILKDTPKVLLQPRGASVQTGFSH